MFVCGYIYACLCLYACRLNFSFPPLSYRLIHSTKNEDEAVYLNQVVTSESICNLSSYQNAAMFITYKCSSSVLKTVL